MLNRYVPPQANILSSSVKFLKNDLAQLGVRADPPVIGNILQRQVNSTEDLVDKGNKSIGLGDNNRDQATLGRVSMDQDLLDKGDARQDLAFDVLCRDILSLTQLVMQRILK